MIIKYSDQLDQVFTALSKAQGEIENVAKTKDNPFFKSQYADLASVLLMARPVLAKHDLCLVQMPTSSESGEIALATMIGHKSGQFIMSTLPCKPAKSDAQAIGSVITYLRRYAASAMVGIAQEDDDGNAGSMQPNGKKETKKEPDVDYTIKAENEEEFINGFQFRLAQMTTVDQVNKLCSIHKAPLNTLKAENEDKSHMLKTMVDKRRAELSK